MLTNIAFNFRKATISVKCLDDFGQKVINPLLIRWMMNSIDFHFYLNLLPIRTEAIGLCR